MRKFRKIYICDGCEAIALQQYHYFGVDVYKEAPEGWGVVGGMDFCPKCYAAYKAVFAEKDGAEDGK